MWVLILLRLLLDWVHLDERQHGLDLGHEEPADVLVFEPGEALQDVVHGGLLQPIINKNQFIKITYVVL